MGHLINRLMVNMMTIRYSMNQLLDLIQEIQIDLLNKPVGLENYKKLHNLAKNKFSLMKKTYHRTLNLKLGILR